jgi:DNA-binding winged helix-turn-helix (wHTH) protein
MGQSKRSTGEVEVDLGRYELRRFGQRIKIEKKPMELLIFLIGRREQMVLREEIVKKLWRSDLFIDTEKNVNNVVRKLRTALGDSADKPRFLETVVGKGYRFVGPVRVIGAQYPLSDPARNSAHIDNRKDGSEWGERSSIAVLPLLLPERAADDQGLSLGFADALVSRPRKSARRGRLAYLCRAEPVGGNAPFGGCLSPGRPICCPRCPADVEGPMAPLAGDV